VRARSDESLIFRGGPFFVDLDGFRVGSTPPGSVFRLRYYVAFAMPVPKSRTLLFDFFGDLYTSARRTELGKYAHRKT